MDLIDIGINLTNSQFSMDRDEVINRALENDVVHMVVTGTDLKSSREAAEMAANDPLTLSATAGLHPHDASAFSENLYQELKRLALRPEVKAIGETGLDFCRDLSPRPQQLASLERHIELSIKVSKPLFLHDREASTELFERVNAHRGHIVNAVVHCFTGDKAALHRYLDLGLYIGITGWICDERRGQLLKSLVKDIPDDQLMIETDAPYLIPRDLSPKPESRRNEPCHLPHICQEIARCRNQSPEKVAAMTTSNARRFFNIK